MHRRLGVLAVACSCKSNNHFSSWLLKLTEHITPLPAGEGSGVGLLLLVILNHLKHVGNLLDAFLQGLLHHLLDEHVEFGLDGEFHLA